jgi:hypothetical protein
MPSKFFITLCNPHYKQNEYHLEFNLNNSATVNKWYEKITTAINLGYKIDDPQRFYGFDTFEEEKNKALLMINNCISVINSHDKIVDRKLVDIHDTDTLNYLHHVFEEYHGLLDQQTNTFYTDASDEVKKALCDLNIAVHRVENVIYGNTKRFVTTYFGLPKIDTLAEEDFKYLTCRYRFGDIYLNYVEVGKTLEDLVRDKDEYIDDDAFKPWNYYSADFTVKFNDTSEEESTLIDTQCEEYYFKNYQFFKKQGYPIYTPQLKPGKIKLGELIYNDRETIIEKIKQHQYVKNIKFT